MLLVNARLPFISKDVSDTRACLKVNSFSNCYNDSVI